jgi:hypothetical protein
VYPSSGLPTASADVLSAISMRQLQALGTWVTQWFSNCLLKQVWSDKRGNGTVSENVRGSGSGSRQAGHNRETWRIKQLECFKLSILRTKNEGTNLSIN